jgi:hypothetical protein
LADRDLDRRMDGRALPACTSSTLSGQMVAGLDDEYVLNIAALSNVGTFGLVLSVESGIQLPVYSGGILPW